MAFALTPAVLLLALGEGTATIAGSECKPIAPNPGGWPGMQGDPELLWALAPGATIQGRSHPETINSLGLRESTLPQDGDGPRVLVLGDSSVYGWSLPDGQHYADLLEEELQVQVINLGVPGYSTEQSLVLLERVGWDYQPDVVVVHSIFSDSNVDRFQDRDAMVIAQGQERWWHHSALACWGYMAKARWVAGSGERNEVLMPGQGLGPNAAHTVESLGRVLPLSRVPLDQYLENLDRLHEQAEAHGATLVLAPLAHPTDLQPPPNSDAPTVFTWTPYRDAQVRWAERHDVVVVDLPKAFKGGPKDLFIDFVHPSTKGGERMVKAMAPVLREALEGSATGVP